MRLLLVAALLGLGACSSRGAGADRALEAVPSSATSVTHGHLDHHSADSLSSTSEDFVEAEMTEAAFAEWCRALKFPRDDAPGEQLAGKPTNTSLLKCGVDHGVHGEDITFHKSPSCTRCTTRYMSW